jgi:hypothetical protein
MIHKTKPKLWNCEGLADEYAPEYSAGSAARRVTLALFGNQSQASHVIKLHFAAAAVLAPTLVLDEMRS